MRSSDWMMLAGLALALAAVIAAVAWYEWRYPTPARPDCACRWVTRTEMHMVHVGKTSFPQWRTRRFQEHTEACEQAWEQLVTDYRAQVYREREQERRDRAEGRR